MQWRNRIDQRQGQRLKLIASDVLMLALLLTVVAALVPSIPVALEADPDLLSLLSIPVGSLFLAWIVWAILIAPLFFAGLLWSFRHSGATMGQQVPVAAAGSLAYVLLFSAMLRVIGSAQGNVSFSRRSWLWALFIGLAAANIGTWSLMVWLL